MVTVGGEGRATACVAEWEEAVARGGKEAWRQVVEGSRWRDERNGRMDRIGIIQQGRWGKIFRGGP
jgi:hypothetical protein